MASHVPYLTPIRLPFFPFLLKERFKRFATVGRAWDMFLLSMVEAAPADRVADFYGVFFSYLIDAQLGTASAP